MSHISYPVSYFIYFAVDMLNFSVLEMLKKQFDVDDDVFSFSCSFSVAFNRITHL